MRAGGDSTSFSSSKDSIHNRRDLLEERELQPYLAEDAGTAHREAKEERPPATVPDERARAAQAVGELGGLQPLRLGHHGVDGLRQDGGEDAGRPAC